MDVSSTKRSVVQAASQILGRHLPNFVPAHPIAGKERAGPGDPYVALYRQRQVILTPLEATLPEQIARAHDLWAAIGAYPRTLSPLAHDRGLAAVSHLPHLLAFAYMTGLLDQADAPDLLALGGPGFRDFSRIAGCDATVWRDILRDNRDQTLEQLAAFRQALAQFEDAIQADEPQLLAGLLQRASAARTAWPAQTEFTEVQT
jgi:prephenate dehydrogenase